MASLLFRRPVDAGHDLASALGREPLYSYQGPEGTRPSSIHGLLVDTRLAALLHAAELLPRGAILGHTPVRFDAHLKGASQRVVQFVRPKLVELALLEEHEWLLFTQRLLDPLGAGWQAALSTGDVDRPWIVGKKFPPPVPPPRAIGALDGAEQDKAIGGGGATTHFRPRRRGPGGVGSQGTAPRGGQGHRWWWPTPGVGGGHGTPGRPGRTTIAARRGHGAFAVSKGVGVASPHAHALGLGLILVVPVP